MTGKEIGLGKEKVQKGGLRSGRVLGRLNLVKDDAKCYTRWVRMRETLRGTPLRDNQGLGSTTLINEGERRGRMEERNQEGRKGWKGGGKEEGKDPCRISGNCHFD